MAGECRHFEKGDRDHVETPSPSWSDSLDEHRKRFKRAPIGLWQTHQGSLDRVMSEEWEFRPDGTGLVRHFGPLNSPVQETGFEWREQAPFAVEARVVFDAYLEDLDDEERSSVAGREYPSEWELVSYDFRPVESGAGRTICLCQPGAKGFWFSMAPLAFCAGGGGRER